MFLDLIKIGNSQGIRIPKSLIEACGFKKTISVEIREGKLILQAKQIEPKKVFRKDWDKAFKKAQKNQKDDFENEFLDFENDWDNEEWTW